jgi:hypothetical protein
MYYEPIIALFQRFDPFYKGRIWIRIRIRTRAKSRIRIRVRLRIHNTAVEGLSEMAAFALVSELLPLGLLLRHSLLHQVLRRLQALRRSCE